MEALECAAETSGGGALGGTQGVAHVRIREKTNEEAVETILGKVHGMCI